MARRGPRSNASTRPAEPVAPAIYLAGDTAGFLTGQVIVLDGGRMSKLSFPTP